LEIKQAGFCGRCIETVGGELVRKKFEGQTFQCSLGCGAVITWLGACDPCIARKESAERGLPETLDHKLQRFGVPKSASSKSWDDWERASRGDLDSILKINQGTNALRDWRGSPALVVLTGPSGTGKTHLAAASMRKFIKDNAGLRTSRFWTEYEFAAAVKASYQGSEDVLARAAAVDLLVLDDFGSVRATDWSAATLCGLLSSRADHEKWTIITTNLSQEEISNLDERLASRMWQALVINTTGVDDARSKRRR
jgi:DNA replication protein DnaC